MTINILGMDIGITSIGWALVETDEDKSGNGKIIDCGVRLFTGAENPKDGSSLALGRRVARGTRRIIKRRKARMAQIKRLLARHFSLKLEEITPEDVFLPKVFKTNKNFLSPWELRTLGLEKKLSDEEFTRVLIHIAKRRGYNDLDLDDESDNEKKVILKSIQTNKEVMINKGYKTIGEMMFKEHYNKKVIKKINEEEKEVFDNVRNKKENYQRSIGRKELRDETRILFESQRKFGNSKATQKLQEDFEKIAFRQRELKSFEDKVGKCQFYEDEKRASKCSYSAELFINLTKIINTLKNLEDIKNPNKKIQQFAYPPQIIEDILNEAEKLKGGLSYKKLREILKLESNFTFRDTRLDYTKKDVEKEIFIKFEKYHKLKDYLSEFEEEFQSLDKKTLDQIAQIIAFNKSQKDLTKKLSELDISKKMQEKLAINQLKFDKTINLSLKALYEILPLMQKGKRYDEAIRESGLEQKQIDNNNKLKLLPPLKDTEFADTLNPVVNRAIAQYRKVLNAIIKKYGNVHKIHLEFTRDVNKNFKERMKAERQQKENYTRNQEALKFCKDIGLGESDENILKLKLWLRQDEYCVYSDNQKITIEDLRDPNMLEIDHIYPLSRSLDDSQNNKVLVFTKQNFLKGNRTPYEWIGNDEKKWGELIKRINTMKKLPMNVKKKIVNRNFAQKEPGKKADFLRRNLSDTSYINRLITQYTAQYLEFLPLSDSEDTSLKMGSKGSKKHIVVSNGSLTSMLRHYWGLELKNRETHLHHAEDALILALRTEANIKAFSDYTKSKEEWFKKDKDGEKPEKLIVTPLENFRTQVGEAISKIFVSRTPRRNVTGALHEQTIRRKEEYFKEFGGKEGVQKAIALGKIREVSGGVVDNGDMVRVDIFKSKDKGKYYVVPVYTYDVAIGKLPNKAVISGKDKKTGIIKDWLEMDEKYEFCFSLFKDDLVEIQTPKMAQSVFAYYLNTSSSTAALSFRHHSNDLKEEEKDFFKANTPSGFFAQGCGIRDLKIFKKCIVSPMGEITEARFEPRQDVSLQTTRKKSR